MVYLIRLSSLYPPPHKLLTHSVLVKHHPESQVQQRTELTYSKCCPKSLQF